MASDLSVAVKDDDLVRAEQDVHLAADVADRDRVAADDADGDHAVAVDARVEGEPGLELLAGEGQQERGLVGEVLADGPDPHPDPPVSSACSNAAKASLSSSRESTRGTGVT